MAEQNSHEKQNLLPDILLLQQRLRETKKISELGHLLVNDTRKLIPYRTAILWLFPQSGKRVAAVSGIPKTVNDAPFTLWIDKVCKFIHTNRERIQFTSDDIPKDLAEDWDDYLPSNCIWLPLVSPSGQNLGGMLLANDTAWGKEEENFLDYWAAASAYSIDYLDRQHFNVLHTFRSLKNKIWLTLAALAIFSLWIPVHLSVLAPAEVVPVDPVIIRAPLDGVIDKVFVRPNQSVTKGTLLMRLDDTSLRARLDVAGQALKVAQAERRRAEQAAVVDRRAAAQLPMLTATIDQRRAESDYVLGLLKRIEIRADIDGIVMLSESHTLEGQPVAIGERIMLLANSTATELEAWLAIGNSIPLQKGATIELFLNISPQTPTLAAIEYINYQAEPRHEGILAFRVKGIFTAKELTPRIGLRGTAKLYGSQVPLYYYLFHRPFAAARQWLGI